MLIQGNIICQDWGGGAADFRGDYEVGDVIVCLSLCCFEPQTGRAMPGSFYIAEDKPFNGAGVHLQGFNHPEFTAFIANCFQKAKEMPPEIVSLLAAREVERELEHCTP